MSSINIPSGLLLCISDLSFMLLLYLHISLSLNKCYLVTVAKENVFELVSCWFLDGINVLSISTQVACWHVLQMFLYNAFSIPVYMHINE